MFKKVTLFLMLIVIFTACSSKKAEDKPIRIGVSIATFGDTYLTYVKDAMEEYAGGLGDNVEVTFTDAKNDPSEQLKQIENFVTQQVDAVVVIAVNSEATDPITKLVTDAGIKLVYVNNRPQNLPEGVVFVGCNQKDAGIMQMEQMAKLLDGKGNIVIMLGRLSMEATHNRTDGVKEVAAKYPDIKIIKEQSGDWSREQGMSLMENWLNTGDQIDAVASNNDDMALGAIKAIEAAGKTGEILVAGVDATPDALAEIERGNMSFTVLQDAKAQGEKGIEAAFKLVKGEPVDQEVIIPFKLVTPENYTEFK